MKCFCIAASLVYLALALSTLALEQRQLDFSGGLMLSVVLASWLAPSLATWIVAEGINLISPRRMLNRKLSMTVRRLALGALAGIAGGVLGVLGMAMLDRFPIPDAVMTTAAAAAATMLAIVPTARVRSGECVFCRYSFAGATPASGGVCTECGHDMMTP